MPWGAMLMNTTSMTPTNSTLSSEDTVTVITCCTEPSSRAPITGPIQCAVPPIIGIAIALTATNRLKAEAGSTKVTKKG